LIDIGYEMADAENGERLLVDFRRFHSQELPLSMMEIPFVKWYLGHFIGRPNRHLVFFWI
jgi:hypothetical protein